jgi:CheY-like chemotaxis protein
MSKRILLIEDDVDARLLLKHILNSAGYHVEELADGNSFINCGLCVPDLFILDNAMPTIDGVALTKYLRINKQTREIPILMMSANPTVSSKAKKAGASEFLAKPFEVSIFLETVGHLVCASQVENKLAPAQVNQ